MNARIRRLARPTFARAALVGLFALAGCSSGSDSTAPPSAGETVEIVRDRWGVPHVFAASDRGAYFGLGWAAAEDRLFQMAWGRALDDGRMAEFLGEDPGDGSAVFRRHDERMRLLGFRRLADALAANLDPETAGLLAAFSEGVNRYAASAGVALHPHFASSGLAWEAWTPSDSIAAWLRAGLSVGSDVSREIGLAQEAALLAGQGLDEQAIAKALFGDLVFDEAAAIVQQSDVPGGTQAAMQDYAQSLGLPLDAAAPLWSPGAPRFSQAWAVSGDATTTGDAVVFADPRLPLMVPNVVWEAHMSGASFEARGVTFPGSANFIVGATKHVAWGASAMGMDQADLFRVQTDAAGHPGQYHLDGAWRPFEVDEPETILVKGASPVQVRYRETIWGPLVTRFAGDDEWLVDVQPGEEYALRWIPFEQPAVDSSQAFVAMYRASSAAAFGPALARWSLPPMNCVFGDRAGHVGYWSVGSLPVRALQAPFAGLAAQDGTTSASAWIDVVPHALMPSVLDPAQGYVLSANHLPVGAWYPIPFTTHGGHTERSARLAERLALIVPGAGAQAAPAEVRAIHEDTVWTFARDLVLAGIALRDQVVLAGGLPFALSSEALAVLTELEDWVDAKGDGALLVDGMQDGALDAAAPGDSALALFVGTLAFRSTEQGGQVDPAITAHYGVAESGQAWFLRDLRAKIEAGADFAPAEAAFVDASLSEGLADALATAGSPAQWAGWFVNEHLVAELPRYSSLEALPPFDPTPYPVGPLSAAAKVTLLSQLGQVHSAFVEFAPGDPRVETLSPMGQSEHEGSPNFEDQRALWELAPQTLKAEPFDRAEIEAQAGPTTTTTLAFGG